MRISTRRISTRVQDLFNALERGRRFVTHDVWYIGVPGEEIPHGFIIKQIRVLILLMRNLLQGAFLMRAAALTFTTLLSVVPCVAIMLIIIQKLNLGVYAVDFVLEVAPRNGESGVPAETLNTTIAPALPEQSTIVQSTQGETPPPPVKELDKNEEVIRALLRWIFADVTSESRGISEVTNGEVTDPIETLMGLAHGILTPKETNSGTIIALSLFVLSTVFGMMWNVESAFNAIWGVRRTRPWYRIFSDYVLIMLLVPFAVATVLGVMVALQNPNVRILPGAVGLQSAQYVVIWAIFALVYTFVPNTKVKWRSALLGGVIAGTLWCMGSWLYLHLQIGVTRNSLIYSSFALFPLLMSWIYVSWIIVLFGAELTFAYQNERTFAIERHAAGASHAYREAVGLRAMIEISRRFDEGSCGMSVEEAAAEWNVPIRIINETLDQLEQAGLVRECASEPPTFAPARSLDKITVGDVVNAMRNAGREPSALREDESLRPLLAEIEGRGSRLMTASLDAFVRRFYPQHEVIDVIASESKELPSPE